MSKRASLFTQTNSFINAFLIQESKVVTPKTLADLLCLSSVRRVHHLISIFEGLGILRYKKSSKTLVWTPELMKYRKDIYDVKSMAEILYSEKKTIRNKVADISHRVLEFARSSDGFKFSHLENYISDKRQIIRDVLTVLSALNGIHLCGYLYFWKKNDDILSTETSIFLSHLTKDCKSAKYVAASKLLNDTSIRDIQPIIYVLVALGVLKIINKTSIYTTLGFFDHAEKMWGVPASRLPRIRIRDFNPDPFKELAIQNTVRVLLDSPRDVWWLESWLNMTHKKAVENEPNLIDIFLSVSIGTKLVTYTLDSKTSVKWVGVNK